MIFYYDSEKNVYPTQLDAIASGKKCWIYFYDKEFMQVDWKTCPTETLDELYRIRAQDIRDNNEYVILCYSGGSDSTNILETFYYNNIHIDEIVIVGALSQDPSEGSDANHNGDLYHNAFPTLKTMNLPNTKITVVDYTTVFNNPNNFTLINRYGNEWTKHIGGYKSVHNLWWYDFKKFVGRNNNKQTCYIMGADKTQIEFDPFNDNKYYVKIMELAVNDYGANYSDENFRRINFYTSPEKTATDIMRKQAHLQMYCKKLEKDFRQETIYYNLKNPLVFKSKKSVLTTVSARDKFMLTSENSEMYDMMLEGLRTTNKILPFNQRNTHMNSRRYYIED